jgi:hypothetical protein
MTTIDADPPQPPKKAMIFTSYGWRDADDVARKLADDLSAAGYEVWIDRDHLRPGQRFPEVIRHAISQADVILVLISPHSVRLPGDEHNVDNGASVCLNELLQAHEERKPIVPVIVVPCEPPWLINIVERIEFYNRKSDEDYSAGLHEILRRIEIARETGRTVYIPAIEKLHALDFRNEIVRGAGEFSGRHWLFERIEAFVAGPKQCLVIEGDAGTGKSAFVAELLRRDPNGRILAYHFCRADQASTVQPAEFVRSIAAMVGGRIAAYGAALNRDEIRVRLVGDACVADPLRTLFSSVITPLSELPNLQTHYIVVDALDEAVNVRGGGQGMTIPRLLTEGLPDFPPWLKLVVTSRRDDRLRALFAAAETIILGADDPAQRADIAAYLAKRFSQPGISVPAATTATIGDRSAGNFLYARQVANAVIDGELSDIDRLPIGLSAFFSQTFQARFPDGASYALPSKLLSILLMAKEPLTAGQIAGIGGMDLHAEVQPIIEKLTGYIVVSDYQDDQPTLALFHKSLADWLREPPAHAHRFRINAAAGQKLLLEWCRNWSKNGDRYALLHLVAHLIDNGDVNEALAAVRAGLFAERLRRIADARADLDDSLALVIELAKRSDEDVIIELAMSGSPWQRDGVAGALQSDAIGDVALVDRIVGKLLALPIPDPAQPAADLLSARRTAIRVAEARQLDDRLLQAARDKSPAVRITLATMVYRYWLQHREAGWSFLERLSREMVGRFSLPRADVLETFGHASLAILNNHMNEPETMTRLLALWRQRVEELMGGPVVRFLGQAWAMRIMLLPLTELMKRQPAYQPLNTREMDVAFAKDEAYRSTWKVALDVLEHPDLGVGGLVEILSKKELAFDVYLMLVCERAFIVAEASNSADTFEQLERLFQTGAPWFRQSVLYILFHVLGRAKTVEEDHLTRYRALTEAFFIEAGASLTTTVAQYEFAPHLAWPEIIHDLHRPGTGPWLLPDLLRHALKANDKKSIELVFKAIDLAGFAYGRHTLALGLIGKAYEIGGRAVEDHVVAALANVRFEDQALVDDLLLTPTFQRLKKAVSSASPTIRGEDIPTWVDGFVVQTMMTSDAFRAQICGAFRRALAARNTRQFLMQALIWVINMLAGKTVASAES